MKKSIFILCSLAILMFACSKDDTNDQTVEEQKKTIIDELGKHAEVSEFVSEFTKLDLSGVDADAFTVFAVKNSGMIKSGQLKSTDGADGFDIRRHIVIGIFALDRLTNGLVLTALNGDKLNITITGGSVYINGVPLGDAIKAGSSMVYTIDEPIPATSPSGDDYLLECIYRTDKFGENQKLLEKFEYDSQKRLVKHYYYSEYSVDENSTTTYTYDASGELKTISNQWGNGEIYNSTFSKNGNEIIVKSSDNDIEMTIQLNEQGLPVKAFSSIGEDLTSFGYDQSNNLIEMYEEYEDGSMLEQYPIFDNEKSPFAGCKTPKWLITLSVSDEINASVNNNPLRKIYTEKDNAGKVTYTRTNEYEYEYNEAGYPTERYTRSSSISGGAEYHAFTYIKK